MAKLLKFAILCELGLGAEEVANVFNTKGYTTFYKDAFSVDFQGVCQKNGGACFTFFEPENREF